MPNGTTVGQLERSVAVFESAAAACPRCGRKLRVTMGEGDALVTCSHRTRGTSCGQKLAIVGLAGRVCLVVQLSSEEFISLVSAEAGAHHVLRRLGLLGVALLPAR